MARLSPQEFREKQARRLKASTQDIANGVQKVTQAPAQKAIAKQSKMKQRLNDSIDSGKWARGLQAVSLQDWQDKMVNKGVGRISAGIDAAAAKVESFAAKLLPFQDALRNQVQGMPDASIDDSIARMEAWVRGMQKFKK